jgi:exopolysaccharide biosynthesis polyprenyl glycosylphosphotransferase
MEIGISATGVQPAGLAIRAASKPRTYDRHNAGLAERLILTSLVCDAAVIVYALVSSYWLRFHTGIAKFGVQGDATFRGYSGYIAFGVGLLLVILSQQGLYEKKMLLRYRHVSMVVLKSALIWFCGFLGVVLLFQTTPPISRMFVGIGAFNVLVAMLVWRSMFHRFLSVSPIAAKLRQRVVFVGWNADAERLRQTFESEDVCAYDVTGCVTLGDGRLNQEPEEVRVLGQVEDLEDLVHDHAVDIVILSDVDCMKDEIVSLANLCQKEMVQFKVIPSYFQILVSGLHLETVSGVPVLGVSRLPFDKFPNILLKRIGDILGAMVGLLLSVPLIAIFGTLVYLESPGPIFYRQRRLGRNGAQFDILKIRSMRLNAEASGGPGWTTANDPRRLKIGAFMRRWNIDEVPQFWNVLKGEMSLVGPRPERPELIHNFKEEIPNYNARHNAKPGITGWAQVKGLRGDTDLTERIKCDLWYLENWNPLLDLQIMLMTFIKRDNAC